MSTATFSPVPVLGDVPAGRPSSAEQNQQGFISVDLNTIGVSSNARTFALRVRGDSMIGAHIMDGDTAVFELKDPHDGAVVAALVDGDCTIKRYFVRNKQPYLKAENANDPDLIPARELVIQGVLVALFRRTT
jgi:repressor LexA